MNGIEYLGDIGGEHIFKRGNKYYMTKINQTRFWMQQKPSPKPEPIYLPAALYRKKLKKLIKSGLNKVAAEKRLANQGIFEEES